MDETAIVVLLALILVALVALIIVLVRRRSGAGAEAAKPEAVPRDPFAAEDEAGATRGPSRPGT